MLHSLYAALLLLPVTAGAAEVAGVKVPDSATVAGQVLRLNGAGLRQRAFFKVYVAALYLPARQSAPAQVLATPGAKRISMTLMRDITAQQLIEALSNGVRDNHTPVELEKLRPRIETLNKTMTRIGNAKSGSVIELDFVPATGTHVALNGAPLGAPIPGEDFYQALLKIWIGDDPSDAGLKKSLLGS